VSFTIAAVLEIPRIDDYNKFRRWQHHPTRNIRVYSTVCREKERWRWWNRKSSSAVS